MSEILNDLRRLQAKLQECERLLHALDGEAVDQDAYSALLRDVRASLKIVEEEVRLLEEEV